MWQEGDRVLCISDYGWTPGCVTVGKVYRIGSTNRDYNGDQRITIEANHDIPFVTDTRCFKLLSEIREEKLNQLGI